MMIAVRMLLAAGVTFIVVVAGVIPIHAEIVEVNVVDPDTRVISETSVNVLTIGLEIVNDVSSPDMLEAIQLIFYNELPFAAGSYRVYHVSQGSGTPVLRRSFSTAAPLEFGSTTIIININIMIPSGNTDTVQITFDVFTDSVSAHCAAYEGTGVQVCVPSGGLSFSSTCDLPWGELCPSGFYPGPSLPEGYRVVFDTEAPICGDADGNCSANISDVVYLLSYVLAGGSAPIILESGDADCNEIVNFGDVVYLIAYIFAGGPVPCAECPY